MLEFIDLRTGESLKGDFCSVLCLGNFDGVHRGHRELVRETLSFKAELSLSQKEIVGGAWCFKQPPADFLSSSHSKTICSTDDKLELFASLGLDIAILGDFQELHLMSPETFVREILQNECRCIGAVCGFNFTFGKDRKGDPALLSDLFGGKVHMVEPVFSDGEIISSTAIRSYIMSGDVESAQKMLGRPYSLTLEVKHGKRLGRTLGTPTINQLIPAGRLVPKRGVYAGYTELDGIRYPSVSNVGINPTVENGDQVKCETYIIGFSGDLYGRAVKVCFLKYLRGESKFSGIEELSSAIHRDADTAKAYFEKHCNI